jgi:hypothetical protein
MIRVSAFLLATLLCAQVQAQAPSPRRAVPAQMRDALVGCWDLGGGETYVIETYGAHGLRSHWEATGRGPTERHHGSMFYSPEAHAVSGGCGATSQHGQHCLFELDASGIAVTTISDYSGRGTRRTVARCGTATAIPDAPAPVVHPVPADAPIADLLTRWRRDIDATRTPTGEADGWTRYGDDLAILFDHGVAMRVRARLAATTCEEAATLAGYPSREGSAPLHERTGCEWPGISARHRLATHVAGRWTAADGVMEIWVTE